MPIKFKCYELSIKFRKLLIKNDCEKWTHFEQNEMILVFEQICNFQKERMSMNECKYSALNTNHNIQIVFINNHSTNNDDSGLSELRQNLQSTVP